MTTQRDKVERRRADEKFAATHGSGKLTKKAAIAEVRAKVKALLNGRDPFELNDDERGQMKAHMDELDRLGVFAMKPIPEYQNEVEDDDEGED